MVARTEMPHDRPEEGSASYPIRPPTVSVLMTVYNGRRYLAEAIESILAQTFTDFEFVIIDDGSSDGAVAMLRDYERRDNRIRLYERPHMGYVRQLNFGLGLCRGAFIARMDADDVALPHRFEAQLKALRADPQLVVVGGGYELIDAQGRLLRLEWPSDDDSVLQQNALAGKTPISHPTAMMRRSAVEQVGGYDPAMETAEDNDLWLRLGEVGRLSSVLEPVLRYRQHDKSVSETRAAEQAQALRRGCESAYRRRGLDRVFEPPPAWRPTGPQSRYQFLLQYGWWAFKNAQRKTAIIYGLKSVRHHPLKSQGWSLLSSALLKSVPEPVGLTHPMPMRSRVSPQPAPPLMHRLTG